jgi:hypothetical protein
VVYKACGFPLFYPAGLFSSHRYPSTAPYFAAASTRLVFCTSPGFTQRIALYHPSPAATASQAVRFILASVHASVGLCPACSKGLG